MAWIESDALAPRRAKSTPSVSHSSRSQPAPPQPPRRPPAARAAVQVHGASGYTWEVDLQLWMKRTWALAGAWGTADWHKQRIAEGILQT